MSRMNKKKIIIYTIGLIVCLLGLLMVAKFKAPLPEAYQIELMNGNTGKTIELSEEDSIAFAKEFNSIDREIAGINLPSAGYAYRVIIVDTDKSAVVVRGEHNYASGVFRYKSETNIIDLIEQYIE